MQSPNVPESPGHSPVIPEEQPARPTPEMPDTEPSKEQPQAPPQHPDQPDGEGEPPRETPEALAIRVP
ncbi:hypothetical protein [Luteibacter sp. UNCMF366Tsu5.1]|uniref:hypothetical protein n=1 Tax=Luteibacter sp. UNCMF366Tsu5.1 TaxID=1502758 RepID=UPI000908A421|nr:hypothetical protein [Luteibacter sp. UNCMF366Tsu5.1]SFW18974.1 hypothetical protein SAMN02800691_0177 [Luteibacter sp. UNCMF366Tsu5.1]